MAEVRAALLAHDLGAFDELVNWDGASKYRRRAVVYQLRYGFGRPIRSIGLEPFPADGFKEIEGRGTLRPNMPVTQQLRVVFDEPDNAFGVSGAPNNKARPMSETTPFPTSGATAGNNAGANDELFSYHSGGVNALFGDGSVRFIKDSISLVTLRALVTAAGGEVVSSDAF